MVDSRSHRTSLVNTSYVFIQTHLPGLAVENLYVLIYQDFIHLYSLFGGNWDRTTNLMDIYLNLNIRTCKFVAS